MTHRETFKAHLRHARQHRPESPRVAVLGFCDWDDLHEEVLSSVAELVPCKPEDPWLPSLRELSKLGVQSFYYDGVLVLRASSSAVCGPFFL